MKFNVEVEIDWIDDESNIDDQIKKEIIATVVNKLTTNVNKSIEQRVENKIIKKTDVIIDKKISQLFTSMMKQEIHLTDDYGDNIKSFKSVREMIKQKLDTFLTQKVDKRGDVCTGYGDKMTRTEYFINEIFTPFAEKLTKDTVETIKNDVVTMVDKGIKEKMGAELVQLMKLDQFLEQNGVKKLN